MSTPVDVSVESLKGPLTIEFGQLRAVVKSWKGSLDLDGDDISIPLGEGEMAGKLDGEIVKIERFDCYGASANEEFLFAILGRTKGQVTVKANWNHGDEVQIRNFLDGEMTVRRLY